MNTTKPAILVVNDNSSDLSALIETLSGAGYPVKIAADTASAREEAQLAPPRFLVLNSSTPELQRALTPPRVIAPIAAPTEDVLTLEALERAHIITVLKRTNGVIEGPKGAALLLNLKPSTARFRMKKLGIARADYVPQA
jgi:transcriptional regulator with GAF, ATPase, and Fis domain